MWSLRDRSRDPGLHQLLNPCDLAPFPSPLRPLLPHLANKTISGDYQIPLALQLCRRFIGQRDSFCVSWKTSNSGLLTLKGSRSFVCWPGGTQTFYDVMGGGCRECLAGVSSASGCVIGSSSASLVEVHPTLVMWSDLLPSGKYT